MSQLVEIAAPAPSSLLPTLGATLYLDGSNTSPANGVASSVVYSVTRGVYVCTFSGVPLGTYLLVLSFTDGTTVRLAASRTVIIDAVNGTWTVLQPGAVNVTSINANVIAAFAQSILTAQSTIAGQGGPRSLGDLITLLSAFAFGIAVPLNSGVGATYYDKKADGSRGVARFVVTINSPTSFSVSAIDTTTPGS